MTAARRLAAILAADVVGYSRLMGEDGVGAPAVELREAELISDPYLDQRLQRRPVDHHHLVEVIEKRVGRRHRRSARANLVEDPLLGLGEPEEARRLVSGFGSFI